jgi:Transposase DDE domain
VHGRDGSERELRGRSWETGRHVDERRWCTDRGLRACSTATDRRFECAPEAPGYADRMNSRVRPIYKTKYRVANWPEYERSLIQRGNVTIWLSPEAVASWKPVREGRRGGQRKYSDLAIETALTLRLVFCLPLRQTEGFLRIRRQTPC